MESSSMEDDRRFPSTSEPEIVVVEEGDDENSSSSSSGGSSISNDRTRGRNIHEEVESTIGGEDETRRRIEVLDKDEEVVGSRMSFRERTSKQLSRSMLFLSLNLEFIAGIYVYLRIRSRNQGWKARIIRILPLFLIPAVATLFSSFLSRFTTILNRRDRRSLEIIRKERLSKIEELALRNFQNYHAENCSVAYTSGSNHPEASRSFSGTELDAPRYVEEPEHSKNHLQCLVICTNCRMHNGFASKQELQFISYTCTHCKAFNGHDTSSSSPIHPPQSIPYNPYNETGEEEALSLPKGFLIEELSPSQVTTDPEMDPPVMIIRESPSVAGSVELMTAMNPPVMIPDMPRGLLIEEITQNREKNDLELDSPVERNRNINDPELDPPVNFQEDSPVGGDKEGMRRGDFLIEEITQNRERNDIELEPPVIFQQEPSVGNDEESLTSSDPPTAMDPPVIEELAPNQEIMNSETDPPVMFVQLSPSVTGEEESLKDPSPTQLDPPVNPLSDDITVQEMPIETQELINTSENETIVTYPDTDADITSQTRVSFQEVEHGVTVTEVETGVDEEEDELVRESRESERVEMNVTYPDTDFEINYSEGDSDYDSVMAEGDDEVTSIPDPLTLNPLVTDPLSRDEYEDSSIRVRDGDDESNELFMSVYNYDGNDEQENEDDDDDESDGSRSITEDPVNSVRASGVGDEMQWTAWQRAEEDENSVRFSEPDLAEEEIEAGLDSENLVSSDPEGESEEISDKEGNEDDLVVKATAALLSSTPSPDSKSKPFMSIGSNTHSKGRSNDFEPSESYGLRHRRTITPPFVMETPVVVVAAVAEGGNGGSGSSEQEGIEGPVIGF